MEFYFALILALVIGNTLLDTVVELLDRKTLTTALPREFEGIYDPGKYARSIEYQATGSRFDLIRRGFVTAVFLAFWLSGGFTVSDSLAQRWSAGPVTKGLLFFGILSLLQGALSLPFSLWSTFVIEERFGFNRTTPKTFIADRLKGALLAILLGVPILAAVLWFFERFGKNAWLNAWAFFTAAQILMLFLAPAIILPLFNKYEPLPDGELKRAIESLARRLGFKLGGIYRMDSSKRSSKSNAFFTGFGRFRKLVLFDTLIEKHSTEELLAVLAHEIGHFKLRHIPRMMAFSFGTSALLFAALGLLMGNREATAALGLPDGSVHASLLAAGFLYTPVSRALSIVAHALSRKHEFEADRYARQSCGRAEDLVSALKKLSMDNFAHLTPHPLKIFVDYTHPPVLRRIEALRSAP